MSQTVYYLVTCSEDYIGPTVCESELDAKVYKAFCERPREGCSGEHKIVEAAGVDWDMLEAYRVMERTKKLSGW